MIAKLTGLVDSSGAGWAVVDVSGVGYLVHCSNRTLANLPGAGESVSLLIETHVREDHIHLYGFANPAEREWYRLLQSVQGVGSRVALAILSALSPEELARTIAAQDKVPLTRATGVGARLAQRVVAELKDKVAEVALGPGAAGTPTPAAADGNEADAVSALVNLGYARVEAFGAISAAAREIGAEAAIESLIRHGLRELST